MLLAAVAGLGVAVLLEPWLDGVPGGTSVSAPLGADCSVALAVGYLFALRLLYLGIPNLMPEEAYYWNYSQHPAFGYRDHPPMVGVLIWITTRIGGNTEFAVRAGALACWVVGAFFAYRLASNLFGRLSAKLTLVMFSFVPAFFATGFVMTPDAPLIACWSATLYYLERALLGDRRLAWYGVGVAFGLGLLSKYTMGLLGPAALTFVLADRPSRRWLARPEPYVAVLIGVACFVPVILWNATHHWTSFEFQGERRVTSSTEFSLHLLAGQLAVLLTPTVLFGATLGLLWKGGPRGNGDAIAPRASRARLFLATFTTVPLLVFVFYSLRHAPKLNWSAPIWIAALPLVAWGIVGPAEGGMRRGWAALRWLWAPTVVAVALVYGVILYGISVGLPQTGFARVTGLALAWRELGDAVEDVEHGYERETGAESLVVGMDTNALSSVLAFYDWDADGASATAGSSLFDRRSLMYSHWFPKRQQAGRNLLLVARRAEELDRPIVHRRATSLRPVAELAVKKNGVVVGSVYYRLLEGYRPRGEAP